MTNTPYQMKSTDADIAGAFDTFMRTFEAYKDANDERLAGIERRTADALSEEKMTRLDRALEEASRTVESLAVKSRRPALDTGARLASDRRHTSAFETYVRKGDASRLASFEEKALAAGTGADGGYTVPVEIEATVNTALRAISPIRAIAGIRQVSATVYRKPFSTSGFATGWVGETSARPQTTTPQIVEMAFPTMELYAMPAATPALLEDSAVAIDQWIADEVRTSFAEQEGAAFVNGDGVNKPKGFLAYPTVANSAFVHGSVGTISTGVAGAFPAANPSDKLIDLVYAVKAGYRANGTFVMNRATQAVVRKMKDADGNYLWQPAANAGAPSTLLGFPVAESEDMPDIAANSLSVAFGDFSRGYLVVDRVGVRVLRDPYSAKPYVLFYTTKRVGGGIQDFDAIKLMKFAV